MKWVVSKRENLISFLQKGILVPCSGKFLRKVLQANLCRVNRRVERFGSTNLERGDIVELAPDWKELGAPGRPTFTTLYEESSWKIVDKPANWICDDANCRKSFGSNHFLVHRLDKDTTGALLIAKSGASRDALIQLFASREIEKEYLALVDGDPKEDSGVRETFLAEKRSFQGQTIWGSAPRGAKAITHWKVLARGNLASLVQCEPVTGRTHQIRVHLSEIGHPILVDRQYAERFRSNFFAKRPLLHARRLRFVFQGKEIAVTAPIPEDIALSMAALVPQANAFL